MVLPSTGLGDAHNASAVHAFRVAAQFNPGVVGEVSNVLLRFHRLYYCERRDGGKGHQLVLDARVVTRGSPVDNWSSRRVDIICSWVCISKANHR